MGGSPGRNRAASRDMNGTSPNWQSSFWNQSPKTGNVICEQRSTGWEGRLSPVPQGRRRSRLNPEIWVLLGNREGKKKQDPRGDFGNITQMEAGHGEGVGLGI